MKSWGVGIEYEPGASAAAELFSVYQDAGFSRSRVREASGLNCERALDIKLNNHIDSCLL